jgi:hypothetical protein
MTIFNAKDRPLNLNSGTLPDVSGAMQDWFLPMTFVRVTKEIVNSRLVETRKNINFRGVWQPLSAQDLVMKPEGQRNWRWFMIHSTIDLILTTDEVIEYQGTQYRVKAVYDYKEYGYLNYHLAQDYTGAGP